MARGRMISYSVSTDKRFNALSTQAALVFLMTVPHLDRDGLILADACIIAGQICPRREDVTPVVADAILNEWIAQGMVIAYEGDDGTILFFTGFAKNQIGMRYDREPKSVLPVPPGYKRTATGLELIEAQPQADTVPPTNGSTPPPSGNLPADSRQPSGKVTYTAKIDASQSSGDTLPATFRQPSARAGARARAEVEVEVEVEENIKESSPIPPLPEAPPAQDGLRPVKDEEIGAVFTAWMENMPGAMTPILKDEILDLVDECTARSVIRGITVSVEQNKRFFKYVASVARNHSAGREPPTRMVVMPKLSEAERSAIVTRGKLARSSLQTAQKFGGYIDPQWQRDIDIAKGLT